MTKYNVSDDEFIKAVSESFSIREALQKTEVSAAGGSYRVFHLRAKKLKIDTSHFTGKGHLKGKTHGWSKKVPLSDLLVENSGRVLSTKHKKRIIAEKLLENKCVHCDLKNVWNNKPIVLHIDHINGNHFDHRIENLRFLCPNCHSQTDTYCSKKVKINVFGK